MSVTLLRTLTERSILKFGIYSDLSVMEVINMKKRSYLAWSYYNLDKITFTDEVLVKIGIREDERIEKPGKDEALGRAIKEKIINSRGGLNKIITDRVAQRHVRRKLSAIGRDRRFRPINLRARNHGH